MNPLFVNTSSTKGDSKKITQRKVGLIAQTDLSEILVSNKISIEELQSFQSEKYSKQILNLQFPLLREIDNSKDISEQKKDHFGRNRYYKEPITINGKLYFLCSQWYEKNRPYLMKWIESRRS